MIQLQVHLQLPCYDFCFLYWRNVGELSSKDRASACPITCIAPSSETTTGGVYKWQGRNRHSLMSYAYEIFLVTRPIIAILGPNWVDVIPVFPRPCGQAGPTKRRSSCSHWHCSARVAQNIEEHHRPAVAQNLTWRGTRNPAEKEPTEESPRGKPEPPPERCLQIDDSGPYWAAWISSVDGIDQTNHSTDQKRPCTTIERIEKEQSICQSLPFPDLVKFPVLSQIKPHAPHLVVPFRQFL